MNTLSNIIADEIRKKGPISMARFMELALYCPVYGYYEGTTDIVGRRGDFHTNVSVGAVFGEILCARFIQWSEGLLGAGGRRVQWVEAGAHDGQLASDVLAALQRMRPELVDRVDYRIVEPSERLRSLQEARLKEFGDRVEWCRGVDALIAGSSGVQGVIFSNELLDAMPVSRFAWDAKQGAWFECLVENGDDLFAWTRGGEPGGAEASALEDIVPADIREALPDGYVIDYSGQATRWWESAVRALEYGKILTIDYGFDQAQALLPERSNGTLRGYKGHQVVEDVLASPGKQDITAHVHFNQIRKVGEGSGAGTDYFGPQETFLVDAFARMQDSSLPELNLEGARLRQFKTLIHPEHFGRSFQVLIQSKG